MDGSDPLGLLHAVAGIVEGSTDTAAALDKALKLMAAQLGIKRGAVCIVNAVSNRIRIEAATGLRPAEMRRGEYKSGEGITGHVIASGKAICIADIAREPLFLNRTRSRNLHNTGVAFICVPMTRSGQAIGALWVDYLPGPNQDSSVMLRILQIVATMLAPLVAGRSLHDWNDAAKGFGNFIGDSIPMRQVYSHIRQVASSRTTVFLSGESGTGKELAAHAIHDTSGRGPFVSVNCAALPENLIESELFGHERGAFTGASQTRKGKFELANGGTLFLDEIGEMSLGTQAKLLRVLQERVLERLGGMQTIKTDVRVIAATNRNLERMVEQGNFRQDLFYRLMVFPIYLPPLRERMEDLAALTAHFLRLGAARSGREVPRISPTAMKILQSYSWPGNIRELENVLERALLLLDGGDTILPAHLPENLQDAAPVPDFPQKADLQESLDGYEKEALVNALSRSHGHIGKAAAAVGLTERKFSLRLGRYGISYKEFRRGKAR